MKSSKASGEQVSEFINQNDGWSLVESKLQKEYIFRDFAQAFAFLTSVAISVKIVVASV